MLIYICTPKPVRDASPPLIIKNEISALKKNKGKTTGWIHRISLKNKSVKMINGVQYDKIDDQGLHYTRKEKQHILEVDNIILCAGQLSKNTLKEPLEQIGKEVHMVGGAFLASELDAKRAIKQGAELAASL